MLYLDFDKECDPQVLKHIQKQALKYFFVIKLIEL